MLEQLQHDIQKDIHSHHQTGFANQGALLTKMDHCVKMLDRFSTSVGNLQEHVSQQTSEHKQKILALEKRNLKIVSLALILFFFVRGFCPIIM